VGDAAHDGLGTQDGGEALLGVDPVLDRDDRLTQKSTMSTGPTWPGSSVAAVGFITTSPRALSMRKPRSRIAAR
jgi:hypothetical protein